MDDLFLIIFGLSLIAIAVFAIMSVIQFIKKDSAKGKKQLKLTGISLVVMVVSFIGFGVTSDSSDTANEDDIVETVAKPAEETAEEKAAREQKEKEEAEAKAKADEEARLKAEAEEKARLEAEAKTLVDKKANAQPIEYAQLKKNPDRYSGQYVKYTGEILQILEGDTMTNIRLAVTKTSYGYDFNDVIFIQYEGYTDFVDKDIITVYGEIYGAHSYESQAGYTISLPGMIAESFE